jgi:hypothetical protein
MWIEKTFKIINNLPTTGKVIFYLSGILLISAIFFSEVIARKTYKLRQKIAESINASFDNIDGKNLQIDKLREFYRSRLEILEEVDTKSIVCQHLEQCYFFELVGIRLSFLQLVSFTNSVPAYLVTLGLIGTFLGLIENLSNLSSLLSTDDVQGYSPILNSMGTAFISSLLGVCGSLFIWLYEHFRGIDRIEDKMIFSIVTYLDSVVKPTVQRYSLMGKAVERIEIYLGEFLSNFTESVSVAIDKAMREKLDEVFNTITNLSEESRRLVGTISEISKNYSTASHIFKEAADTFSTTDFATNFTQSTQTFLVALETSGINLETTVEQMDDMRKSFSQLIAEWTANSSIQSTITNDFKKSVIKLDTTIEFLGHFTNSVTTACQTITEVQEILGETSNKFLLLSDRDLNRRDELLIQLNEHLKGIYRREVDIFETFLPILKTVTELQLDTSSINKKLKVINDKDTIISKDTVINRKNNEK